MPARQRGQTVKRGSTWGARWYDEANARCFRGGFETKSQAREWLDRKVDEVAALRRGDVATLRRRNMPTLAELVEEFTRQHVAEPSTIASLEFRLRYALEGPNLDGSAGWADVRIDRLNPTEIGAWRKALPARSAFGIHKCFRQVLHYTSIAAGVSLFELSRLMGTSSAMLDRTYGHLLPDALDRARSKLDSFVWARSGHSAEEAER